MHLTFGYMLLPECGIWIFSLPVLARGDSPGSPHGADDIRVLEALQLPLPGRLHPGADLRGALPQPVAA